MQCESSRSMEKPIREADWIKDRVEGGINEKRFQTGV